MAIPFLAIPVAHSAGGFIAYAGSGYLAGTLSSSWLGAFVAGNAAAVAGAAGTVVGAAAGAAGALGITASTPVVGGAAVALGLTAPAWALPAAVAAGISSTAIGAYGAYRYFRKDGSEVMTYDSEVGMYADAIAAMEEADAS